MRLRVRIARALRAAADRLEPPREPAAHGMWLDSHYFTTNGGVPITYWINGQRYIDGRPA